MRLRKVKLLDSYPWYYEIILNKIFKPKPKYRLASPFMGTETEYAENPKPKPNYEEFWNRNRAMENLETKTETDEAKRSETGRFLSMIILLGYMITV